MKKITLTTTNLSDSLNLPEAAYYVVENVVELDKDIMFPQGSVVDLAGGAFKSTVNGVTRRVNLNESSVRAASFCIFTKDITVSGFANSFIKSEWFKDTGLEEHEAINRSLIAAQGIPVHLESRTYRLTGSITFPTQAFNKTLVSPGILQISDNIAAIVVSSSYINLDINQIQSTVSSSATGRGDTGILLTGNAYYIDIKINIIKNIGKAIAVIPEIPEECRNLTGCDAFKDCDNCKDCENSEECEKCKKCAKIFSGIQYCTIRFNEILNAEYCLYVDILSKSKFTEIDPEDKSLDTWFSEARVIGGRMSGVNGIYFVNPDAGNDKKPYAAHCQSINGLLFENIWFENFTGIPLFMSHISSSKFLYLRFGPGMPGANDQSIPWIYLNYVSYLTISMKGRMDPMRIKAVEEVKSVVLDTCIIDDFGWYTNHFDRLAIMPVYDKASLNDNTSSPYRPQMVSTSSVQPYNMAKTIFGSRKQDDLAAPAPLTIRDLLPRAQLRSGDNPIEVNVLPSTLNVIIKEDEIVHIDLTGLHGFGQCVIDVFGMVEAGGSLMFSITDGAPVKHIKVVENGYEREVSSVSFNERGLYRLNFDSNWNIVITKVTY